MNRRRYLRVLFVISFAFAIFGHTPGEWSADLEAGPERQGAEGEVMIKNYEADQKEVVIYVKGLKPSSVYSVWLAKPKFSLIPFIKPRVTRTGLGPSDHSFKSDHTGRGRFQAVIELSELRSWRWIRVGYHPDGDPTNLNDLILSLQTDLREIDFDHAHEDE